MRVLSTRAFIRSCKYLLSFSLSKLSLPSTPRVRHFCRYLSYASLVFCAASDSIPWSSTLLLSEAEDRIESLRSASVFLHALYTASNNNTFSTALVPAYFDWPEMIEDFRKTHVNNSVLHTWRSLCLLQDLSFPLSPKNVLRNVTFHQANQSFIFLRLTHKPLPW